MVKPYLKKGFASIEFISRKDVALAEKFLGRKLTGYYVILPHKRAGELLGYLREQGLHTKEHQP